MKVIAGLLLMITLTACGGGDEEPDQTTQPINCQGACKV